MDDQNFEEVLPHELLLIAHSHLNRTFLFASIPIILHVEDVLLNSTFHMFLHLTLRASLNHLILSTLNFFQIITNEYNIIMATLYHYQYKVTFSFLNMNT